MEWQEKAKIMVETQIKSRGIKNPALLEAMAELPRHLFVPKHLANLAYSDCALPIGEGQTISQPYIVAKMTELLDPKPNDKVLEIGTGSGYQAALLASMGCAVFTIERIAALALTAKTVFDKLEVSNKINVRIGDGRLGWPEEAPFDCIIVTAAAPKIEDAWIKQLAEGGRLVVPLVVSFNVEQLVKIMKVKGKTVEERHDYCSFVPLLPGVKP
ncbi:MAG TPA: protein-L-isoaspartate(D-aspartate) O-methyltransferase [Acetomicrobium flavidum]|uniref:protein-L-isoaspartate(D-aspartate) O-methyltransferase n=1 Tax=Acetomicrobium flavidum TaxID=49896 RepID=UPI002B62A941|nr:protein-L-isoaspartate(D-aspartate) O-methyltransferase [Acetomicrobium flavidum]